MALSLVFASLAGELVNRDKACRSTLNSLVTQSSKRSRFTTAIETNGFFFFTLSLENPS